jgi:hypothetical protein
VGSGVTASPVWKFWDVEAVELTRLFGIDRPFLNLRINSLYRRGFVYTDPALSLVVTHSYKIEMVGLPLPLQILMF